jgi:hypothetical protein
LLGRTYQSIQRLKEDTVRSMTALIVTALLMATSARAQTPQTPQQALDAAAAQLRGVSAAPKTEAGRQIETLQRDFAEFMSAYAQRETRDAAGSSASSDANWRTKYLIVEADLTTLIGPANAPASGGLPGLDGRTRATLQQARTRLGTFYASTIDAPAGNPIAHTGTAPGRSEQPVPPTAAAPQTPGVPQPAATQPPPEQVPAPTRSGGAASYRKAISERRWCCSIACERW